MLEKQIMPRNASERSKKEHVAIPYSILSLNQKNFN